MPKTSTILRVFVASPSDLGDERAILEEVITELNNTWSKDLGVYLELVKWETHAYPGVGADPQAIINEQIADDYDVFIGLMWARIGTPTSRADSGTEEEFSRALRKFSGDPNQIRIMFYFKDAPIAPNDVYYVQLGKMKAFQKELGEK